MNISEAARHSGLSAKQIRDYEKQGLLAPAARSDAGYRRYGAGDLARLHFIRHAREVGFSLKQIATLLRLQEDPRRHAGEVKRLAAEHIAALNAQIASLRRCAPSCSVGTMPATATSGRNARFWTACRHEKTQPELRFFAGLRGCLQFNPTKYISNKHRLNGSKQLAARQNLPAHLHTR